MTADSQKNERYNAREAEQRWRTADAAQLYAQAVERDPSCATARNNLIYDSDGIGLLIEGGNDITLANNTLFELTGDTLRIEGGAQNVHLRNNILWAENGFGVALAADSQTGFASDTNIFFHSIFGTGRVGTWDGVARSTFAAWRAATHTDTDSLFTNPQFVDVNGADNVLGFDPSGGDGRDDDFHERSQFGSFHGGSLAPVEGFSFIPGIPGRPIALIPVETLDATQSPAIDRGAAGDPFAREPAPNGGFINIGAYGNTEQASKSPLAFVFVLAPNGGEAIHQRAEFDIRWREDGFAGTVDIDFSATGLGGTFQTLAAGEANDGLFEWTVDPALFPAGSNYIIRVRASIRRTR